MKNLNLNINSIKVQKGITLVSMIITIIVLVILFSVSISYVLGDNGLLNNAQKESLRVDKMVLFEDLKQSLLKNYINLSEDSTSTTLDLLINNNYLTKLSDSIYLVDTSKVEKYTFESGKGSYDVDNNIYKDVYIISINNSTDTKLPLYYYDEDGSSQFIGTLGTNMGETTSTSVADDFWINNNGVLSINSKYKDTESVEGAFILKDVDGNTINELVIPSLVNGTKVTTLTSACFHSCSNLNKVTISDEITTIEHRVFYNCPNLTSVTLPDSVTSIDVAAFQFCSSLANINIPNNITHIPESIFNGCTSLTSIAIPDSVTSIDLYAFFGCSSLSNVTLSNSLTSIGDCAFSDCPNLTNITIPDTITYIGDSAFVGCNSLNTITIKGYENQSEFDAAVASGKITLGANWKPDSATLIFEK